MTRKIVEIDKEVALPESRPYMRRIEYEGPKVKSD